MNREALSWGKKKEERNEGREKEGNLNISRTLKRHKEEPGVVPHALI